VDEPLVWYEGAGTSDRRWLVQDQLGSVIAVTNASGAVVTAPNTYDEYGVPGASNLGRFQYTGQIWLPEANLYHYKARAYAPSLGRFLQSDPILYAGGMNLYAYVGADPVNARDPLGLQHADPEETPGTSPNGTDHDTIVVTAEDWERAWRLAMDARADGRLAAIFALLANINWDAFYAAHPELLEDLGRALAEAAACAAEDTAFGIIGGPEGVLAGLPGDSTYTRLSVTAILPAFGIGGQASITRYTNEATGGRTYIGSIGFSQGWAAQFPTTLDGFGRAVLRGGASAGLTYGIANEPSSAAGVGPGLSFRGGIALEGGFGGGSWELGIGGGLGASFTTNFSNVRAVVLHCG
jgi:RHS repeat-associated protein